MLAEFEKQFVTGVERAHSHVMWEDQSSDVHVVIWPTWGGLSQFEKDMAEDIASWGHAVTAVDLYGVGNNPTELQDKMDTMTAIGCVLSFSERALNASATRSSRSLEGLFESKDEACIRHWLSTKMATSAPIRWALFLRAEAMVG